MFLVIGRVIAGKGIDSPHAAKPATKDLGMGDARRRGDQLDRQSPAFREEPAELLEELGLGGRSARRPMAAWLVSVGRS